MTTQLKKSLFCVALLVSTFSLCAAANIAEFERVTGAKEWKLKFSDSCRGDWQDGWFLDGKIATVENSEQGMDFAAGEKYGDDAHHAVLWTKDEFKGDVKIEYNYTRTDSQTVNVNILYIQAQGIGEGVYKKDISKWSSLREVPTMSIYYKYMNPLHISYAAFPMVNDDLMEDYLRVRKYPIDENISFDQMEVEPTLFHLGLFLTDVTYKVTVIKSDGKLHMRVEGDSRDELYTWDISDKAPLKQGRIGLRHMYTRSARYSDFKVYVK